MNRQLSEDNRARAASARILRNPTQAHHFEQLGLPVPAKYLVGRDLNTPPAIPLIPLPRLPVSDVASLVVHTKILVAADPIDPAKNVKPIKKIKATLACDSVGLVKPAATSFREFEMVSLTHIIETQFQNLATIQKMDTRARRLAAITEARSVLRLKHQIEESSPITFMGVKNTVWGFFVGKKREQNEEYVERLADLLVKKQGNDWETLVRKLERFEEFWGLYKRVFAEENEAGTLQEDEIYIIGTKGKKADFVRCVKQNGITGAVFPSGPLVSPSSSSLEESALEKMVLVEQRAWNDCEM
ncbi:hypothetical protein BJ875DRAFT_492974 [Amylocarpus encephaloides]|uniref:Uncharacterized protein n=1 Tax=Amylocarpus encephaloides TaxID=45428 RepID=A0A9P7YQD6_9HELO|nr:hypothetical protein BJ875DRAFT_492974 [Amylocarpus encephaloides]